jgi:hypothetical protein
MKKITKLVMVLWGVLCVNCLYAQDDNDTTVFSTSGDYTIATILEDSDIVLGSDYLSYLQVSTLTIAAGHYEIAYNEHAYGTVIFNVSSAGSSLGRASVDDFGLRIAKRHSKKCHSYCECSIGFRCGFVTSPNLEDPRTKLATMVFDPEAMTLTVVFSEYVDWMQLDQGMDD